MARSPKEGSVSPSASLRGTRETLSDPELESVGSDSEINGFTVERRTDKYGFLLKSDVDGRREEEVPVDVLRQREAKWLDMLSNWDKWMAKRHKKIKLRCHKGIPPSLRGRAWQYLSGSRVRMDQSPHKFSELDSMAGDPKWLDIIERDLHRQFPFHEMFVARGGHGQQDLFRVLKAYTLYRPDEGYCQAQAPIAAVLLMHMPAEQAFWCLVQICEKYLPGYYSEKLVRTNSSCSGTATVFIGELQIKIGTMLDAEQGSLKVVIKILSKAGKTYTGFEQRPGIQDSLTPKKKNKKH